LIETSSAANGGALVPATWNQSKRSNNQWATGSNGNNINQATAWQLKHVHSAASYNCDCNRKT